MRKLRLDWNSNLLRVTNLPGSTLIWVPRALIALYTFLEFLITHLALTCIYVPLSYSMYC